MNLKLSIKTIFLLVFSAVCYGISFVLPNHLWFFIFLYPIFILLVSDKIGLFGGFLWSAIAHGIHLIGIGIALYQMNTSLWIIIGMFLYVPCITGLIFALIKTISSCIEKCYYSSNPIINNAISIFLTDFFIKKAVLFPFGRVEGYPFMNPVILFVDTPFQSAIQLYNTTFLTLLFYSVPFFIALFMEKKQKKYFLLGIVSLSLFLVPNIFTTKTQSIIPSWVNKIAVFPIFLPNPKNISAIRDIIQEKIAFALQKNPELELFVLPEGAINCPLSCEQIERLFTKKVHYSMIICSQCFKKQKLRNSCFFIKNNTCQTIYHKRHSLPVTEQPILYQTTNTHIWPSKNKHLPFFIDQNFLLLPYICSDFFFNEKPDDDFSNIPIIALCNDIWFSGFLSNYIQQLMRKTVQFKAIIWHRPIVYVVYSTSYYIDTDGNLVLLRQIQ